MYGPPLRAASVLIAIIVLIILEDERVYKRLDSL
jgi:hypothetical protein